MSNSRERSEENCDRVDVAIDENEVINFRGDLLRLLETK